MSTKLDKSGKCIESISEDDVKVVCFLKDDTGRPYVQLSFSIPGEERAPTVLVPMAEVNSKALLLSYLPENYVIRFASSAKQHAYMRQIISEAQKSDVPCYDMIKQGYNIGPKASCYTGLGILLSVHLCPNVACGIRAD